MTRRTGGVRSAWWMVAVLSGCAAVSTQQPAHWDGPVMAADLPPPAVLPRVEATPRPTAAAADSPPAPAVLPQIPIAYHPSLQPVTEPPTQLATSSSGEPPELAAAAPQPAGDPPLPRPQPLGLPAVPVPADNPLTAAKVALGERLFYDPGLSADRTVSCASCHRPSRYFADGRPRSAGFEEKLGERNAPTVLNAAYAPQLLWDGRVFSLEEQVRYPVTHPLEMNTTPERVAAYVGSETAYEELFRSAFGAAEVTFERLSQAIASFERTLVAGNSRFDLYMAGDESALTPAARRGWDLFRHEAGCIQCHHYDAERPFFTDFEHYNTGIGWTAEVADLGRFKVTRAREDKGAFRTPPLRNVAETAPYMHDGSLGSLAEVIDFYARGGVDNPYLDPKMRPLELSERDKADLLAFLQTLTGEVTYVPQTDEATSALGR